MKRDVTVILSLLIICAALYFLYLMLKPPESPMDQQIEVSQTEQLTGETSTSSGTVPPKQFKWTPPRPVPAASQRSRPSFHDTGSSETMDPRTCGMPETMDPGNC